MLFGETYLAPSLAATRGSVVFSFRQSPLLKIFGGCFVHVLRQPILRRAATDWPDVQSNFLTTKCRDQRCRTITGNVMRLGRGRGGSLIGAVSICATALCSTESADVNTAAGLIDVRDDRRRCHASGKGERNHLSYEYFCHAHPGTFVFEANHAEYSEVVLKDEYLLNFLERLQLPSLTVSRPVT